MVDPKMMCSNHLRGEHVEHHMFLGTMKIGKSLQGYMKNNLLQLKDLVRRHDILAEEMLRRGFKHDSPLLMDEFLDYLKQYIGKYQHILENSEVDVKKSEDDLFTRCPNCLKIRESILNSEMDK